MTGRLALVALLLLFLSPRTAAAASCSAYASSITFVNYNSNTLNVTGSVTVTCSSGTAYAIGLSAGYTSGATITKRMMFGGSGGQSTLGYQLLNDAARTSNWGNTSGTGWITGTGTGSSQTYTVYARIPAGEFSPLGSYTYTIIASITGSFTTALAYFSVTATEQPGCTISAGSLNFGNYAGTLINSNSTILVACTNTTPYNIGLSAGLATGATVTTRKMQGPASATLSYKVFRDAARTLNWGNTVGTDTVAGTGSGTSQSVTVYGQLPAGQSATSGNYTDTIMTTVTY